MKEQQTTKFDFIIDKLTNSIENAISGEVFDTSITKLTASDARIIKKSEWAFDWQNELKDEAKQVSKLTTVNNLAIIQGLISFTDKGDHIFMNIIESAKFNKGKNKLYKGVAGNLIAFCCKTAFELNYDGVVSFVAKTQLVSHYQETLGAKIYGGNRMFIDTKEAFILTTRYFKDFKL
ncbi:hypothetical protein H9N25_15170 [Pedobacter riviphilus]|uniref:N-acetyltransferase domain-containing protein n=1 Tax=Pedobacter riviphilus TaxID=2766984 RepID=A0ABX6TCU8_9SPHI|nr:hypothetical protein [Pedobacter riviphilus]QNR83298.1 hypothetical protein H9N25_15170 [Pedobacter riviphilus]